MNRILATAAAVSLACAAAGTFSLGFGKAYVGSVMGQPFEATVLVRVEAGDESLSQCVSADVFYGETRLPANTVTTDLAPGGGDERQVRVRSTVPVDEPVVSVYVTVGCTSRLTRKWVSFADPPLGSTLAATDATPPIVAQAVPEASVASAPVQPARRLARAKRPAGAVSQSRSARTAVSTPSSSRSLASVEAPRPRLQMEVIDAARIAGVGSSLKLSDKMPALPSDQDSGQRAAAAALWRALNTSVEDLQRDRQRLEELESGFEALRDEMSRSQQALAKMEARVVQAQGATSGNPWAIGLGFLVAVLAGALGWLAWQRWREHLYTADWHAGAPHDDHPSTLNPPSVTGVTPAPVTAPPPVLPVEDEEAVEAIPSIPFGAAVTMPADDHDESPTAGRPYVFDEPRALPVQVRSVAKAEQPPAPLPQISLPVIETRGTPRPMGPRTLSVEELIDLEQQADFFVVLGQDEAALDLLLAHVRDPGVTTPLPYLKLLEIYQRRGEHIEYERLRKHFNVQFNASAPGWDEDLEQGPRLDEYPSVMGSLQRLWGTPELALETLRSSLVARTDPAKPFTLPAYRELLFLYSIARDLAERNDGGVDVLLPLEGAGPQSMVSAWASLGSESDAASLRKRESAPTEPAPQKDALTLELVDISVAADRQRGR